MLDAADRLLSTAISRVRQPIESLFNWIEEKPTLRLPVKLGLMKDSWFMFLAK